VTGASTAYTDQDRLARRLDWMRSGTELLVQQIGLLAPGAATEPSILPGWTRAHVLAHVDQNAGALGNLIDWAATGIETPMYSSPQERSSNIERGSQASQAELVVSVTQSAGRLDAMMAQLPEAAWASVVRTAMGRSVPAAEVPWMRSREVWIHVVDLDVGVGFEQLPSDFLLALIDEVAAALTVKMPELGVRVTVSGDDRGDIAVGAGSAVSQVRGSRAAVASWLTGRGIPTDLAFEGQPVPELASWL
jgi:maleylpyruvate isomerase